VATTGLSQAHWRFLVVEQCVGSAVFNFLLNGAIAWLMFRALATVPLWGEQSIAGDTIGTTFFLPFFTCLIVTRIAYAQIRSGKLAATEWQRASHPVLGRLPHGIWKRSLVLGLIGVVLAAPVSLWAIRALGVESMGFWRFVAFKATFAALLAAIFTPVIALCALGDAPR
jgi:hypothetical protein